MTLSSRIYLKALHEAYPHETLVHENMEKCKIKQNNRTKI